MRPLSVDEQMHAEKILKETEALRKKVMLYKKGDPALARFRVTAMNHIQEFIVRKVQGKKQPAALKKYLEYWQKDQGIGKNIIALFDAMENF